MQSDPEMINKAMLLGCNGCVLKSSNLQNFSKAIQTVLSGKPYFSPEILRELINILN